MESEFCILYANQHVNDWPRAKVGGVNTLQVLPLLQLPSQRCQIFNNILLGFFNFFLYALISWLLATPSSNKSAS